MEDIKGILFETVRELGLESLVVASIWEEVVGKKIARNSSPLFFKRGTLYVATSSATWSQELSYKLPEIIKKINKRLKNIKIKEIKLFSAGIESSQIKLKTSENYSLNSKERKKAKEKKAFSRNVSKDSKSSKLPKHLIKIDIKETKEK